MCLASCCRSLLDSCACSAVQQLGVDHPTRQLRGDPDRHAHLRLRDRQERLHGRSGRSRSSPLRSINSLTADRGWPWPRHGVLQARKPPLGMAKRRRIGWAALERCVAPADPTCESVYKYEAGTFRLRRSCCSEAAPPGWCKHCEVYYADKCSLGPCNTGQGGTTYFKPGCDSTLPCACVSPSHRNASPVAPANRVSAAVVASPALASVRPSVAAKPLLGRGPNETDGSACAQNRIGRTRLRFRPRHSSPALRSPPPPLPHPVLRLLELPRRSCR